jgi:chromosome partitioning protein
MALRRRVGRPFPNALIACHDGPGEAALGSVESVRSHGTGVGAPARQTPRFTITRVAELVGRTSAAIRDAEKEGRLPSVEHTASGRRMGYALGEINQMRAVFGTRPWRTAGDPLSVIAVQNFKGSVGKSTVASHLAQYLAIKGYRVCLVDCDSQGSSTAMFGYVPDLDIEEDDTLYPFFRHAEMASLAYAVRETHWDGLYLVPANLKLYSSEYELAGWLHGLPGRSPIFSTVLPRVLRRLAITSTLSSWTRHRPLALYRFR